MATSDSTTAATVGRTRFVNALRTTGASVHVVAPGTLDALTLRVQSAEAWNATRVLASATSRVHEVKAAAMARLLPDVSDRDAYVVKLRGIDIDDESVSLAAAGAVEGSTLLLVSRRRRPLR